MGTHTQLQQGLITWHRIPEVEAFERLGIVIKSVRPYNVSPINFITLEESIALM